MDDGQTVYLQQHPHAYGFDLDMAKRGPLDLPGGPESKKARWSPGSYVGASASSLSPVLPNGTSRASAQADPFANYGYGNGASVSPAAAAAFNNPANGAFNQPLYSTPQLSINVGAGGASGMASQMSPGAINSAFAQQQAQAQAQQVAQAQQLQAHQQQMQHQMQQAQQQQAQVNGQNGPNAYNGFGAYGMGGMLGMGLPGMNMLGVGGFPYSSQAGSFQQAGPYSPQASVLNAAALASSAGQPTSRTVYVGNLPSTASVDELLNLVHFGPLESIRVLPEKSCVFLSFLDAQTASAFHADATIKKIMLHNQELKIGWGKPSAVPSQVLLSIQQSNASRNVYIGGLDEGMTEEMLRDDLSRFGLIDQVKIVRDKNIGFVHFLSISTATKVVATLPTEPTWAGKRVNYGKDRCAYIPKSQQAAAQAAQAAAAQSLVAQSAAAQASFSPLSPGLGAGMPGIGMGGLGVGGGLGAQALNRTVYLGNIHPDTTTEDLCNAIRGGVLQSIRYMQDKHIAFVTFIDPTAAFTFFQVSSYQGLTLNGRRIKIGWGKNSGPLPAALALAVHSGATRNVYIGNVEDFDKFNEEKLRTDFGEFGEIELINFLKEKNCAFVNFTNISNAIKAIDGVKAKPDYANLRIAHGKDRCANPPRSGPQGGGGGMRRSASGNSGNSTGGLSGNAVGNVVLDLDADAEGEEVFDEIDGQQNAFSEEIAVVPIGNGLPPKPEAAVEAA